MSANTMILLTRSRSKVVMMICDSEGNEMGRRRIFTIESLVEAMEEAEKIMQTQDIEYGIIPMGFIQKKLS